MTETIRQAGAILLAVLLSGCLPDLTGTHRFTANIEKDGEGGYRGNITIGEDADGPVPEPDTFDRPPGLDGPHISRGDVPALLNHAISDADWLTASDLLSSARPYRHDTLCWRVVGTCTAGIPRDPSYPGLSVHWRYPEQISWYMRHVAEGLHELYGEKGGIHLIKIAASEEGGESTGADYLSYGGWLDSSAFRVDIRTFTEDYVEGTRVFAGAVWADATSLGMRAEGYPAVDDSLPLVSATWNGLMVGAARDEDRRNFDPIQGEATLTYYPGANPLLAGHHSHEQTDRHTMNADFTDIYNLRTGDVLPDIRSLLQAEADGTFASFPGVGGREQLEVRGRFYGPNHEEAGGIITDRDLVGAFGARREAPATPGGEDASGPE